MVVLNRIYTRGGDAGDTSLGDGQRRPKYDLRVEAYGCVDEANSAVGLARLSTRGDNSGLDAILARVQNDLFDLGADLCTPETDRKLDFEPLRIAQSQVDRLEREIDALNANLAPLRSFVLPAGSPAATALHLARTTARRAERRMVELARQPGESVGEPALRYINRLSDLLFVAARCANRNGADDALWTPGQTR